MKRATIQTFIRENRWVTIASLFFILWKFLLIGIMWDDRSIPPEPDDSFEYIGNIASVSECRVALTCPYPGVSMSDSSGFNYLSYRYFFGLISRYSGLTPDLVYHFGFYLGTFILPFVLISFLFSFTSDKKLIAWTILFLAFYHGTGETHGFFWVVPSFFTVALFFVLYAYIVRDTSIPRWGATWVAIIFTFSHPIGIYLTALFPISILYSSFLSKTWDLAIYKKMLLIVGTVILGAASQSMYLNYYSQTNYYGFNMSAAQATSSVKDLILGSYSTGSNLFEYRIGDKEYTNLFQQRIDAMNISYFRYIFPHWSAFFPLLLILVILYIKKHYHLLSLYISALLFFISATLLNEYGFRSAIILWPLTFSIYAFGSWYLFVYVKMISNPVIRCTTFTLSGIAIFVFFSINALLAVTFNSNLNLRKNYSIDPSFSTYLEERLSPDQKVSLNSILVRTPGGSKLFLSQKVSPISTQPAYVVLINESANTLDYQSDTKIQAFSQKIVDMLGIPIHMQLKVKPIHPPKEYSLEKTFGVIEIYRRTTS